MQFTKEQLLKLYSNLVRTRAFDQAAVRLNAEGKLFSFYHPALGGEAPGVGGTTFLRKDDVVYPHLRGHGFPHLIGKGCDPKTYLAEHCGRATGSGKGLGGVHAEYPELGIFGGGGTIGSAFPVSVGWGVAAKKNGWGQVVVCFFGDGSSNRGTFHEAANMAAVWKLPVVWVCENNGVAQYVPIKDAYPLDDIASLGAGYGMPAVVVDGQDVVAVAEAVMAAVERAREGHGPSLVECKTLRFGAHGIGNPDKIHGQPRDPEELEAMRRRDPVELFRSRLLEQGVLTPEDIERIDGEAQREVEEARRFIDESPSPDDPSLLDRALYAD
ncbi:MAG: thiamine pyrophosphate-dependent dehydrogenase E1 component subunit alpha [Proteobacteria bacterium]|nr:thiamine pyrophosphate-dependent dehydrogenase E1 component subunit alpha [Pseudomonadota bacterium]